MEGKKVRERQSGVGRMSRKLGKGDSGKGRGAKARRQVGVAAVTSSVSSKMPLREERKVLSTAKPWSPAAAPSSGGPSRRFKALSISSGAHQAQPLTATSPGRETGRLKPGRMGKQTGEGRHYQKPESEACRPVVRFWEKAAATGGMPRGAFTQLPRVAPCACTSPLEAHGEGRS